MGSSSASNVETLAKEREDINKLVTDLIGGSSLAPPASNVATPSQENLTEPSKSIASVSSVMSAVSSRQKVKLVIDELAAINIRPKVT